MQERLGTPGVCTRYVKLRNCNALGRALRTSVHKYTWYSKHPLLIMWLTFFIHDLVQSGPNCTRQADARIGVQTAEHVYTVLFSLAQICCNFFSQLALSKLLLLKSPFIFILWHQNLIWIDYSYNVMCVPVIVIFRACDPEWRNEQLLKSKIWTLQCRFGGEGAITFYFSILYGFIYKLMV